MIYLCTFSVALQCSLLANQSVDWCAQFRLYATGYLYERVTFDSRTVYVAYMVQIMNWSRLFWARFLCHLPITTPSVNALT
jgi:hypothetical protein